MCACPCIDSPPYAMSVCACAGVHLYVYVCYPCTYRRTHPYACTLCMQNTSQPLRPHHIHNTSSQSVTPRATAAAAAAVATRTFSRPDDPDRHTLNSTPEDPIWTGTSDSMPVMLALPTPRACPRNELPGLLSGTVCRREGGREGSRVGGGSVVPGEESQHVPAGRLVAGMCRQRVLRHRHVCFQEGWRADRK